MNRRAIAEVALWSASLFAGERPASKIVRDTLLTRVRTPPDSRERFPADDDERHEVVPTERSFGSSLDPTNGAGRMTSLAPHLSVPGTLLAGAAGGGIWKTTDSGATWSGRCTPRKIRTLHTSGSDTSWRDTLTHEACPHRVYNLSYNNPHHPTIGIVFEVCRFEIH